MSFCAEEKSVAEMDARERSLYIDRHTPKGGLYTEAQRAVHPDSNSSWRVSPEPWWLPEPVVQHLKALGRHLHRFYRALNLLYSQSTRGIQPAWVAAYLDQGKTEEVIKFGRMNRFKGHLPYVIRPDVIPVRGGMVATELDSIPGGIGFTASLGERYGSLGYDIVGGSNGMVNGFMGMIRSVAGMEDPVLGIVISEESSGYRPEMQYLGKALQAAGLETYVVSPDEVVFTESGLFVEDRKLDVVYRFFELFDLRNLPKIDLILYAIRKGLVKVSPPMKAYPEEKMMMALYQHPLLQSFWGEHLGKDTVAFLDKTFPKTWILDPAPLPPFGVIPGLEINGQQFSDWRALGNLGQKHRQLVIKPSGFSDQAWGSRGVSIGHDMAERDWQAVIEQALSEFATTPHILQEFHNGTLFDVSYYDFETDRMLSFKGRVRLQPYYFVMDDEPVLSGVQATICPADKKVLHGMVDAVVVPCGVK
ncbi:MAG: hypothetical protein O7G87_14730 [bacterium]|nr:hypothetical protein [bacterium]